MKDEESQQKPDQPIVATGSSEELSTVKNPAAVELGRLGGLKGGKAAAAKMTPEQRRKRAKKAAIARWRKKKNPHSS